MSSTPVPHERDHELAHEQSESDSRPLLDNAQEPAGASDPNEFHHPVYQPDYRYSYTDENFNYYPSGPATQSDAKLDEPFTPKPEEYHTPQDYTRQTRYEDMGASHACSPLPLLPHHLLGRPDYAEEPFSVPAAKQRAMYANGQPNMFQRYFGLYPLSQRIEDKKRGIGVQKYPIACEY